ncbi:MAG: DUF3256 family protein [Bacteroidia bacterium]|nr:DUF3256 family protein [Bacteroidia bacterium]
MKGFILRHTSWAFGLLFFSCLTLTGSSAQAQDIQTFFVNMPDSLSPLLTPVNRADCVDFMASHMKAEVTNVFGGKSELKVLGKDYLRLQLTSQTTCQMKLLTVADSTRIIAVVSTSCAPVCDSAIKFYTTNWKLLPTERYLKQPVLSDFFLQRDSMTLKGFDAAYLQTEIGLLKADFDEATTNLKWTLTTPDYLGEKEAEKLKPFLRRELLFSWKEGQFNLN